MSAPLLHDPHTPGDVANGAAMRAARERLKQVFGFDTFRPGQEAVVASVLAGRDTLAILPTGGGKSLCYQLPAICGGGVTVVVSPLIALMRDQVRALRAAGVAAGALTSAHTAEEIAATQDALREGTLKLLYIAPERLGSSGMTTTLRRADIRMIAVDEAHCISQWGHDFRPDYLRIGALRDALGVPLAAFTATADVETRAEIVTRLFGGCEPAMFLGGFDRPNIRLAFAPKSKPREQILAFAAARPDAAGIVYCGTRAKTESLASALRAAGRAACAYHGGLEADLRRDVERRFQVEDGLIVVATIAFGMGVDKPDIRWVAHADLPKSIEAYYQEIGRAGRDGAPADTLTLFGADDIRLRRAQIDESAAAATRRDADHGRLNALLGLAEAIGCRRRVLLSYFGEEQEDCGNCDTCAAPPATFDATDAVRKALSAMLRTGERFGTQHLIDVLLGRATDKVRARGHEALPTFGAGSDLSQAEWQGVFRQMMGRDWARPDPDRHGALRMTEAARPVLRGEVGVELRRAGPTRSAPRARALVGEDDAPMLAALKAKRRELAQAQGVPAYVIFNDRTLVEMAERRPGDLDALAQIGGVGAAKLERYGAAFLSVLSREAAGAVHPARRRLAGRKAGTVFDQLQTAQTALARGVGGSGKYLACTAATLRHVAERRPSTQGELERIPGMSPRKAARFGPAFLAILSGDR